MCTYIYIYIYFFTINVFDGICNFRGVIVNISKKKTKLFVYKASILNISFNITYIPNI